MLEGLFHDYWRNDLMEDVRLGVPRLQHDEITRQDQYLRLPFGVQQTEILVTIYLPNMT